MNEEQQLYPKARLIPILDGPGNRITVFFHGFLAIRNQEEFNGLVFNILSAYPRGRVYLFAWQSGDFEIPIFATASAALKFLRFTSQFPLAIGVEVSTFIRKYKQSSKSAEECGKNLKRHLAHITDARDLPIYLIGHSLGARVIFNALVYNTWEKYDIRDVVFMGGAVHAYSEYWHYLMGNINGGLYNGFSKSDRVLTMTPDFDKNIGRYEILHDSDRLFNVELHGIGHTDYWPNLGDVLDDLWPKYKKGK